MIKDFYQNSETKINDTLDDINIDDIKEKDKLFYLFFNYCFCCKNKCCKKKINKHFEAIDNFIKYLEESLRSKNMDKHVEKYINDNKDKSKDDNIDAY